MCSWGTGVCKEWIFHDLVDFKINLGVYAIDRGNHQQLTGVRGSLFNVRGISQPRAVRTSFASNPDGAQRTIETKHLSIPSTIFRFHLNKHVSICE